MRVRLGDFFAECPYCGATDFLELRAELLEPAEALSELSELACAACGGYASRVLILERLAEQAGELGRLTLARLREERSRKRRR